MKTNESFPYEKVYMNYLKNGKNFSEQVIENAYSCSDYFWRYFLGKQQDGISISDVRESDVRSFLNYLENDKKYTARTINKYITYLKKYFVFLFEHGFIKNVPTLSIKGHTFNRTKKFVINWMPSLKDFINNDELEDDTKKALILIAYGFDPKEFVNLTWNRVSSYLNDNEISKWLENNLDFSKISDPFIFSKKDGSPRADTKVLRNSLLRCQDILPIPSALSDLRLSYIYSMVSNTKLSDEQLINMLHCSQKSLAYYKNNLSMYDLTDYSEIKKKEKA